MFRLVFVIFIGSLPIACAAGVGGSSYERHKNPVKLEGCSDVPKSLVRLPSNWVEQTKRPADVLHLMISLGESVRGLAARLGYRSNNGVTSAIQPGPKFWLAPVNKDSIVKRETYLSCVGKTFFLPIFADFSNSLESRQSCKAPAVVDSYFTSHDLELLLRSVPSTNIYSFPQVSYGRFQLSMNPAALSRILGVNHASVSEWFGKYGDPSLASRMVYPPAVQQVGILVWMLESVRSFISEEYQPGLQPRRNFSERKRKLAGYLFLVSTIDDAISRRLASERTNSVQVTPPLFASLAENLPFWRDLGIGFSMVRRPFRFSQTPEEPIGEELTRVRKLWREAQLQDPSKQSIIDWGLANRGTVSDLNVAQWESFLEDSLIYDGIAGTSFTVPPAVKRIFPEIYLERLGS